MATNPPINHPVIGMNGLITPVWAEFFLKLANSSTLGGYMLKSTYDPTNSRSVVDSDKLGGELPSYYLDLANHTGSLRIGHVGGTSELRQPTLLRMLVTCAMLTPLLLL